jgi:hypothetical protein
MATNAIESGEFLVMKRDPSGLMTVDPKNIAWRLTKYPCRGILGTRLGMSTSRLVLPSINIRQFS